VTTGSILGYFEFWTRVLLKIETLYVNYVCSMKSAARWKEFDINHYSTFIQSLPNAPPERSSSC